MPKWRKEEERRKGEISKGGGKQRVPNINKYDHFNISNEHLLRAYYVTGTVTSHSLLTCPISRIKNRFEEFK